MTSGPGSYQSEIYAAGLENKLPPFTTNLAALESSAAEIMRREAFGYVAGSAGAGKTAEANRAAFDRWRIVPRMLRDATARQLTTTVFDTILSAPALLAPVGVQSIVHPEGELATARAAAELDVPMIMSTASSYSIEDVAEANGDGSRWFQLYWPNDPDVCVSFLQRAEKAGFSTLVVTLDTWQLSWRPADLDAAFLPFLRGIGTEVYFSDPVFRAGLAAPPEEDMQTALARWITMFTGTDRSWDNLPFLREHWGGPIVLKGIQHIDDARKAAEAGMDGIVVSNHGGRQVDGAVASLDVLPGIAEAVGDKLEVLFDSGIRTGADAIKALSLGARAVLLGRPYVYGLAHGGQEGIRHVVRSFLAELDLTMSLSGNRELADLGPHTLARA